MRMITTERALPLLIGLALVFAFAVTTSVAQEPTKIAGKIKAAYTKQDTINIGDTEGHNLTLAESKGNNTSTGKHKFMDGAQVTNMYTSDLVKGTGPHRGYIKFAKNGDATFAKWEGKVTTTISGEGSPIITFEGTFAYIKGASQFENIQGRGIYRGEFISKTEYMVEWEGEYLIKK
jgi:hypothetical protein